MLEQQLGEDMAHHLWVHFNNIAIGDGGCLMMKLASHGRLKACDWPCGA